MTAAARQSKPAPGTPLTPAQQQLVARNTGLIGWAARRWAGDVCRSHDREHLNDCLLDTLVRAAQLFDEHRGVQFQTYASWWLRHGVSRWRYERQRRLQAASLSWTGADGWAHLLAGAGPDPAEHASLRDLHETVRGLLKPRLWTVIRLRLLEGWSLAEVGSRLRLSKERVRQLQVEAIDRLRAHLQESTP